MFVRQDIPIALDGKPVEVEVICGFAHHMDFDCELFDPQGNNPQPIMRGSNLQSAPPPFAINVVPPQLTGRFLLTTVTVQSLGGTDLSVVAVFTQGGAAIGEIRAEGQFDGQKTVSLVARFTA